MIKMEKFRTIIIFAIAAIIILFVVISTNIFKDENDGKFEKATAEKIKEFDRTNNPTEYNMYSMKSVNHEEMAMNYFNDYKNMIVNYPDEAYELVINREEITEDKFYSYRSEVLSDYYSYQFEKYSYYQDSTTNNYVYRVTNTKGETFTFKTTSVMVYGVNITL